MVTIKQMQGNIYRPIEYGSTPVNHNHNPTITLTLT